MCVCVGNGECLFSILDLAQKFLLFRSIHLGSHIYIYIYTYCDLGTHCLSALSSHIYISLSMHLLLYIF